MWIVTAIYWLQLFLCPVIICGAIGVLLPGRLFLHAVMVGGLVGIIAAEYVRRNIGLPAFFAGIYGSKEIVKKLDEMDKKER